MSIDTAALDRAVCEVMSYDIFMQRAGVGSMIGLHRLAEKRQQEIIAEYHIQRAQEIHDAGN